ncbi:AAA family ATPase [Desulfoscipio geothermicus]|uniref:ATPase family associated with various cellular activities (AAA) n=1 Tax=Desulfoscipio geothermicus DSM 3669 TaxID=1121426 RepID=A0A1I6DP28_9FIRM|nr:ATP-binding protein [Desulfoscipio geothermicus]SFR07127.1 ATPase family associated with various cellular activities (AAA) [Desulfoscipio geothermicus DSM 3669]
MARSDLLINLVRAGSRGDQLLFRKTVEAIIAEERKKQHHILASRLEEYLKTNGSTDTKILSVPDGRIQNLFCEITPQQNLDDLILPKAVMSACSELVEEHQRRDLLRSYGLEPRHRILLVGPPGNGKTSLAEALAKALMVPLIVVRYEGIIASYLGETAIKLRRLFDFIRTHHCILFFDEFDTLGKERGDAHETGEIKRVVSSLLLQIDDLPSHVIVVTATNHPELLDRAVWRRFQLRMLLPAPKKAELELWFKRFEKRLGMPLGYAPSTLAEKLEGLSFAEIEEFGNDILRRRVLTLPKDDIKSIVNDRIRQWKERFSLLKRIDLNG